MPAHENRRPDRREIEQQIDKNLKRAFDEVAREPVPDRFMDLLQQLRESDATPPPKPAGGSSDDD